MKLQLLITSQNGNSYYGSLVRFNGSDDCYREHLVNLRIKRYYLGSIHAHVDVDGIKSLSLLQTMLGVSLAQVEAKLDRIISEGDAFTDMLTCLSKSEIFIKNIII